MRDELRLLYKAEYWFYPSPSPVGDAARSLLPVGYGDANGFRVSGMRLPCGFCLQYAC